MQFAGRRTDLNLKPIGEPFNMLIKITPDVLPDPDAIMVTGITPQQTIAEGLSEAEFLKIFYDQIVMPGTIFVGYNSVRFDDEFIRFLNYRNFYDAYEWQWKNQCSRWDLLDVVRMTRALRPEGIKWAFASDGKPSNRLELLTSVNKLSHDNAHDALADVEATISLARLIRTKQSDLFDYLLGVRGKKEVAKLVEAGSPFVYTSGRYGSEFLHTTVALRLADHPQDASALVYDLRADPTPFIKMTVDEIVDAWRFTKDPDVLRLPVKTLKYNRCPAIAPLGVIKDQASQENIKLNLDTVKANLAKLKAHHQEFAAKVLEAVRVLDEERQKAQTTLLDDQSTVDGRLYDGFISDYDRNVMPVVRAADPSEITTLSSELKDDRLKSLLPLYKARNYPKSLDDQERAEWEAFCNKQLFEGGTSSRLAKYFARLEELAEGKVSTEQQYLLEELQLYGQSIVPMD